MNVMCIYTYDVYANIWLNNNPTHTLLNNTENQKLSLKKEKNLIPSPSFKPEYAKITFFPATGKSPILLSPFSYRKAKPL